MHLELPLSTLSKPLSYLSGGISGNSNLLLPNLKYAQYKVLNLHNIGYIKEAAENLKKFKRNIDTSKMDLPKSLNIITRTGMNYRRTDGINVISLALLGK